MKRLEMLQGVDIFSSLAAPELESLLEITTTRRVATKEVLFHKGDPGNQLYGVLSGRLKVMASSRDGREVLFSVSGPGDVIGEIALIDSNPRSATVVGLEDSELLTLHRRDFLPFIERNPLVAIHLASVMAKRVRDLSQSAEDAQFMPLALRMAKRLVRLGEAYSPHPANGGEKIDIRLSQQDLADLVGTSRESINKQLRAWEEQGLLSLRRGHIDILDNDSLEDIAEMGIF
jgi:CRP/FNR family cyclic AMP-dependent transcriptional regulator